MIEVSSPPNWIYLIDSTACKENFGDVAKIRGLARFARLNNTAFMNSIIEAFSHETDGTRQGNHEGQAL